MAGADAFNDLDLGWVERALTEAQNQNALEAALEEEAMMGDAAVEAQCKPTQAPAMGCTYKRRWDRD